jgi:N-acetylglucosamine malate deacetylase 1
MPCDLLVIAPHPDDAEISCGATIARHVRLGASVVMVDATRGEMSSRGTPQERQQEAAAAAKMLGVSVRENLGLRDGHLRGDDLDARAAIIDAIRRHAPSVVIGPHGHARHPDHIALGILLRASIKGAALHGLQTASGARAHAGARLWFAEAELRIDPDFLVPAEETDWQKKMAAVGCYQSQLHKAGSDDAPKTVIGSPDFLDWIELRGRSWGREAGSSHAEAFVAADDLPRIVDLRCI